jgi:hypothetical protein
VLERTLAPETLAPEKLAVSVVIDSPSSESLGVLSSKESAERFRRKDHVRRKVIKAIARMVLQVDGEQDYEVVLHFYTYTARCVRGGKGGEE